MWLASSIPQDEKVPRGQLENVLSTVQANVWCHGTQHLITGLTEIRECGIWFTRHTIKSLLFFVYFATLSRGSVNTVNWILGIFFKGLTYHSWEIDKSLDCPGVNSIDQIGLKLIEMYLILLSKCRNQRGVPSYPENYFSYKRKLKVRNQTFLNCRGK